MSAYLSDDFQSSPSGVWRVRGPGTRQRHRTLKENLLWTRSFDTIESCVLEFRDRYNQECIEGTATEQPGPSRL